MLGGGQLTNRGSSGVAPARTQFFLDPEQLVVFRDAVGPARRAGLDLTDAGRNGQVGDRGVLGLTGSVRDDARYERRGPSRRRRAFR